MADHPELEVLDDSSGLDNSEVTSQVHFQVLAVIDAYRRILTQTQLIMMMTTAGPQPGLLLRVSTSMMSSVAGHIMPTMRASTSCPTIKTNLKGATSCIMQ